MLELDLIGRNLRLADADLRWLRAHAEAASGSSVGARDLVTRLDASARSTAKAQRLVLTRPEVRVLRQVLDGGEVPDGLRALDELLTVLLAPS